MNDKKANYLVVIENGQIRVYPLDDRTEWEVGRSSPNNVPDIRLHSETVSRRHGKFQNMDGMWFYLDYNGKNGTVYNHRHLDKGLRGNIKPVPLQDGDVFVFGGGSKEVINHKTVWCLFSEQEMEKNWRVSDSEGLSEISFVSGDKKSIFINPDKGTVVKGENGIAIYMGDLTYISGDMMIMGK